MKRKDHEIDAVLWVVRSYWKAHPELRLTQLIGNCVSGDPHYVQDNELVGRMIATHGSEGGEES